MFQSEGGTSRNVMNSQNVIIFFVSDLMQATFKENLIFSAGLSRTAALSLPVHHHQHHPHYHHTHGAPAASLPQVKLIKLTSLHLLVSHRVARSDVYNLIAIHFIWRRRAV